MELEFPFDEYPKNTISSLKIGDITKVLSNNHNKSVYAMCPYGPWDAAIKNIAKVSNEHGFARFHISENSSWSSAQKRFLSEDFASPIPSISSNALLKEIRNLKLASTTTAFVISTISGRHNSRKCFSAKKAEVWDEGIIIFF